MVLGPHTVDIASDSKSPMKSVAILMVDAAMLGCVIYHRSILILSLLSEYSDIMKSNILRQQQQPCRHGSQHHARQVRQCHAMHCEITSASCAMTSARQMAIYYILRCCNASYGVVYHRFLSVSRKPAKSRKATFKSN